MQFIPNKQILFIHDNGYQSTTEGFYRAKHKPSGVVTEQFPTMVQARKALTLLVLSPHIDISG